MCKALAAHEQGWIEQDHISMWAGVVLLTLELSADGLPTTELDKLRTAAAASSSAEILRGHSLECNVQRTWAATSTKI